MAGTFLLAGHRAGHRGGVVDHCMTDVLLCQNHQWKSALAFQLWLCSGFAAPPGLLRCPSPHLTLAKWHEVICAQASSISSNAGWLTGLLIAIVLKWQAGRDVKK